MTRLNLRTLTTALSLSLLTAACGTDPDRTPEAQAVADVVNHVFYHAKWKQVPTEPPHQAEAIVFQQSIFFADGSGALDREDGQAIDQLLKEAEPKPGTVISLSAGASDSLRYDQLTLQRLEATRLALADRGYEAVLGGAPDVPAPQVGSNEVRLSLTKWMPILPDCDLPQPLPPNRPDYDQRFGCFDTYNLGAMVAKPEDLVRGQTLEPGDGEAQARGIERYRLGEITPLIVEETSTQ